MFLDGNGIVIFALNFIFVFIDKLIYPLDAGIYDLMLEIASQRIFSEGIIEVMKERVYQLLGLIMIFKLTFSFITYLLNPDQMLDKNKGFTNLLKRIVVVLILIICVPWAFDVSRKLQEVIIDDHVIEYFVFGTDYTSDASPGQEYMYTITKAMVRPRQCTTHGCDTDAGDTDGKYFRDAPFCNGDWPNYIKLNELGKKSDLSGNSSFKEDVCGLWSSDEEDYKADLIIVQAGYQPAKGKYPIEEMLDMGRYFGKGYKYKYADYKTLVATAVGGFIGYTLILMCIDVAVRAIKLSFYELISPIPIISYIGFKDGKDTMLTKWYTQTLKTYADLFIRIVALQFSNFFIGQIMTVGLLDDNSDRGFFVWLFLILAALTFAKKFPDILKEIGIDLDGGKMFSLKKRLDDAGPIAKAAGRAAVGLGSGALGGMAGNWAASRAVGRGIVGSAFSALGGGVTGTARGFFGGAKAKNGIGLSAGYKSALKGGQKLKDRQGTSFVGRNVARLQTSLGLDTAADKIENESKVRKEYTGYKAKLRDAADSYRGDLRGLAGAMGLTKPWEAGILNAYGTTGNGIDGLKKYLSDLEKSGASATTIERARKVYETARDYVIDNADSSKDATAATLIAETKKAAAVYAKKHSRALTGKDSTNTEFKASTNENENWTNLKKTFDQIDSTIAARAVDPKTTVANANKNFAQRKKNGS